MQQTLGNALITGGARRIGAAIAHDLARQGFAVAIHYNHSRADAEKLAAEIRAEGGRAETVQADLTNASDVAGLLRAASAAIGPITLLVNNASIFENDTAANFGLELLDRHFAIHLKAPAVLTRDFAAALPANTSGLIVNIIDQRVWKLTPDQFTYTLSKSALWTATQTFAQALAPRIRVNAIGPGPTMPSPRQSQADFQAQVDGVPLKRATALDEFGRTIRYLWDTPSVTGQMIAIDGGQHLAWQTPDVTGIVE